MSLKWQRSSFCSEQNGCVEVAAYPARFVAVRESDNPLMRLIFTPAEWDAFIAGVKDGQFDFDPATTDE